MSVVLATLDGMPHLPAQLDSLLAQGHQPAELLVGDDGSSDGTLAELASFAARAPFPVRVHRRERRLGYAENFLQTAAGATSELIAFCDQDDVWLPEKLARAAAALDDPGTAAVVHAGRLVDADLSPLDTGRHTGVITRMLRADPLFVPHGSRTVFRASLMRDLPWQRRPRSLYGAQQPQQHDEWVHFAASVLGRVVHLPDELLLWRRHASAQGGTGGHYTGRQWLAGVPTHAQREREDTLVARAEHLRALAAEQPDPCVAHACRVAADGLARTARSQSRRVRVRDTRPGVARLGALALNLPGYRPQRWHGLGVLPLVQDLVSAAPSRG